MCPPPRRFAALIWGPVLMASSLGSGPADDLLKITPPHSAATLVVESLRDQARAIIASPLLDGLQRSSAFQQGSGSLKVSQVGDFARRIEAAFGIPIASIRDQVLGEAAVLAFFPGPDNAPQDSRGLLLTRRHDRGVVEKVFEAINQAQMRNGELLRIEQRTRGSMGYAARIFGPGVKLYEFYVHLDDSTFAWSNSETLIKSVIDLKLAGGRGLADVEGFGKARQGLPASSLASLFVAPAMIRSLRAGSRPPANRVEKVLGLIFGHYADAIAFAAVGLVWNEGLAIHLHEVLNLRKLDAPIRGWLSGPPNPPDLGASVPASALAVASVDLDLPAIRQSAVSKLEPADFARFGNIRDVLRALLAGVDPINDVLPRIKPHLLAYIDSSSHPDRRPLFPIVGAIGWSEAAGLPVLGPPIDGALRAFFALRAISLEDRAKMSDLRVETVVVDGTQMTVLTNGKRNLAAYRVDGGRLVVGRGSDAVKRFGSTAGPLLFQEIRDRYLADSGTFAILDMNRSVEVITKYRVPIARRLATGPDRPIADVERDLDQLLSVASLFRAAAFVSEVCAGGSEVHRKLLLLAR